jgi:hypothetical protein
MVCLTRSDFSWVLVASLKLLPKKAKSRQPRVVVCGKGVALLRAEGKADAAIRIERGCNDLVKTHEVDILCAYPSSSFHGEEGEHVFQSICAEHSAVCSPWL